MEDIDLSRDDYEKEPEVKSASGLPVTIIDGYKISQTPAQIQEKFADYKNIPIVVSVEFGATKVDVREFLTWRKGKVLALDKLAGETADVKMNGRHFARGEIIINNEKYAIRLTDILSPQETKLSK